MKKIKCSFKIKRKRLKKKLLMMLRKGIQYKGESIILEQGKGLS
jgi:hypothetical protein